MLSCKRSVSSLKNISAPESHKRPEHTERDSAENSGAGCPLFSNLLPRLSHRSFAMVVLALLSWLSQQEICHGRSVASCADWVQLPSLDAGVGDRYSSL